MSGPDRVVTLAYGTTECRLHPAIGGAIGQLVIGGIEVLRCAPPDLSDPLGSAAFPMVPFANRIFPGTVLGGRTLALPADPEGAPAALHGHGWRQAWRADRIEADRAVLSYRRAADPWPWAYQATLEIAVTLDGLDLAITVSNEASQPMPTGLGLHPYMSRQADSFVDIAADRALLPDPRGLPSRPSAWPPGRSQVADLAPCDAFLPTRSGLVRFGTSAWAARIEADCVAGWQLYCPKDQDFYCLEPASHVPGGIGEGHGGAMLDPGASTRWSCSIRLE